MRNTFAGLAILASVAGLKADIVTYDLSVEFSGASPPGGAAPWLRATFDDGGGAGSVDLRLEAANLTGTEFVFQWTFNLDPLLDPTDLIFSAPTKTGSFDDPVVGLGTDSFMADGDGLFDIRVLFANSDGAPTRFGSGDAAEYTITGIAGLTASSFDYLSAPAGGQGPFPTAAHVGGIGANGEDSGWITVPEPASLALLLLGACVLRRRA